MILTIMSPNMLATFLLLVCHKMKGDEKWKDEKRMKNSKANHCIYKYESMKAFLFLPIIT